MNLIEMQDEDGNVMKFEHLLTFEVDEDFYVAFTPIEKMEEFDVGEVLIMRIRRTMKGMYICLLKRKRSWTNCGRFFSSFIMKTMAKKGRNNRKDGLDKTFKKVS